MDDVELVVTIWYEEPLLWWNSKYNLNQCTYRHLDINQIYMVRDHKDHHAQLSLMPEVKYYNTRFRATMSKLEAVRKGTKSRLRGADLMALFGGHDDADGTVGIAYIGTACWEGRNDARVSINEWRRKGDADLGRTLAHEVGHQGGETDRTCWVSALSSRPALGGLYNRSAFTRGPSSFGQLKASENYSQIEAYANVINKYRGLFFKASVHVFSTKILTNQYFFLLFFRRERCNSEEDLHQVGQQTSEKGKPGGHFPTKSRCRGEVCRVERKPRQLFSLMQLHSCMSVGRQINAAFISMMQGEESEHCSEIQGISDNVTPLWISQSVI